MKFNYIGNKAGADLPVVKGTIAEATTVPEFNQVASKKQRKKK